MSERVELLMANVDERLHLRSPEVGWFTCALDRGQLVVEGTVAGSIRSLGRSFELVVPKGVVGRIVTEKPERVHEPVGYGTTLYTLDALETVTGAAVAGEQATTSSGPAFLAPHSGRFWHRSAPGDPAFVEVGAVIETGQTIGLIEVMKTFTHLAYAPGDDLPAKARVTGIPAADGAEVTEGEPLIEVEPA